METTVDLDKKTPTNTSIISRSFYTIIVEENTNISDKNTSIDANYLKKTTDIIKAIGDKFTVVNENNLS